MCGGRSIPVLFIFWLLTWYLTQLVCSLPVCRILKPRAEESGEYLCVFVFSNSPVANATIEVRGTFFCCCFLLSPLPKREMLSLPLALVVCTRGLILSFLAKTSLYPVLGYNFRRSLAENPRSNISPIQEYECCSHGGH